MELPASNESEVAPRAETTPSRTGEGALGGSLLWASNAPFIAAALLALAGGARLALTAQHASLEAEHAQSALFARIEGEVASARLTLPPALDPHAAFELRIPRAASLQLSTGYRALAPARCDEVACVHWLEAWRSDAARTISAQFRAPGRHDLVVSQRASHGDVQARYAVLVTRAP